MLRPQHVEQKQPYVDDSCKLLLHFNGISGNQQFIDSSNIPKVVTAYGNACLSNTHYRFGGTSGYFGGAGDYLSLNGESDFAFGIGDFSISFYTFTASTMNSVWLYDSRPISTNGNYITVYTDSSGHLLISVNGSAIITGTTAVSTNAWNHIGVIRNNGITRLYLNGVQEGSNYSDSTDYINGTSRPVIGRAGYSDGGYFTGYISELMVFKGISKPIGELYPQARPYGYPIGGT